MRIALCALLGALIPHVVSASKASGDLSLEGGVSALVSSARSHWLAGRYEKSYDDAGSAIAGDGQHAEALYLASRFLVLEMLGPQDRGTTIRPVRDVAAYIQDCEREAIGLLVRALGSDPKHRDARLLLGLVYYEGRKFMRMVGLFEDLRRRTPDDPEAYLMLSLALAATGNDNHARGAFGLALSTLSTSPSYLEAGFGLHGSTGRSFDDLIRLWAPLDPYAMTPINERLMEHYHRVAYANLRFGEPLKGQEGWRTDRGSVYVMYGAPSERVLVDEDSVPRQDWDYGSVRVSFLPRPSDPWVFRSARYGNRDIRSLEDLAERRYPVTRSNRRWPVYDASARFVQFRGKEGRTRVDVLFALPEENLHNEKAGPGARTVDLKRCLTVFSEDWERLDTEIIDVSRMPVVSGPAGSALVWSDHLELDPGGYQVAVEALDAADGRIGQSRANLSVRTFTGNAVELSDILIGRRFLQRGERGREGLIVLPTVDHTVRRGQELDVYLEAYNLERDVSGMSHLDVVYEVRPEDEGSWQKVSTQRVDGGSDWEPMRLSLDLGDAAPGRKRIRVTVKDAVGECVATTETDFTVLW